MNRKVVFCIATGLFWFSMYTYVPYITNYAKEMGASYQVIGFITGSYGLTQTLLRIPLGILSDRLNTRKIFITLGLLVIAFSTLTVFLFPRIGTLLSARLLAGVAASTWVNYTVLFADYYPPAEGARAMGVINATNKAGQFIAVLTAGFVAMTSGVRHLFLFSAIGGTVGFILSLFLWEEKGESRGGKVAFSAVVQLRKNRQLLLVSTLAALSQVITYSTAFGFTPLVAANLGASPMELSVLAVCYNFPQIAITVLAIPFLLRLLGKRSTLLLGFAASSLLCMLTPFSKTLPMLYVIQILGGIANAITFPLLMAVAIENVESYLKTTVMGFFQAAYGVGMIFGPIVMGSVSQQFGMLWGFFVTGMTGVVAIVLLLVFKRAASQDWAGPAGSLN